jgi:hypothetical protein
MCAAFSLKSAEAALGALRESEKATDIETARSLAAALGAPTDAQTYAVLRQVFLTKTGTLRKTIATAAVMNDARAGRVPEGGSAAFRRYGASPAGRAVG